MQGECSVTGADRLIWNKLWKLHIPDKIKVFSWRAIHDILPTCENLTRRHIVEDSTCALCKSSKESTIYALWECPVAQDVWTVSSRRLQKGVGG